ncbi:Hypothetical protein, putative [Bodo saltans]|uniref:Uncharacterized protein n=1 Tax=Bodo saltans TaxID=75058 RepID=A0A0S4J2W8_BODSA|nr:Hypothetical protein, putative [Bodo saltans]|eukprot:CUG85577.1 Hypothetical protein, putative [Bodo saltans]
MTVASIQNRRNIVPVARPCAGAVVSIYVTQSFLNPLMSVAFSYRLDADCSLLCFSF